MTETKQKTSKTSTKWESTIKSLKIFSYGFVTGIVLLRGLRYYQIRRLPKIDRLESAALSTLRGNPDVRQIIGTTLRPGLLSYHNYTGGIKWKLPTIGKKVSSLLPYSYEPWGLHLLFQVIGDSQAGFVTVETLPGGQKDIGSDIGVKVLFIDFHDGQRLVLRGCRSLATS